MYTGIGGGLVDGGAEVGRKGATVKQRSGRRSGFMEGTM